MISIFLLFLLKPKLNNPYKKYIKIEFKVKSILSKIKLPSLGKLLFKQERKSLGKLHISFNIF